jgi:hypothetical protein
MRLAADDRDLEGRLHRAVVQRWQVQRARDASSMDRTSSRA